MRFRLLDMRERRFTFSLVSDEHGGVEGLVTTKDLLKELVDTFRVEIIGFVIALVAMVGVMSRAGGVQGLIQLLLGFARTVRSTLFVTCSPSASGRSSTRSSRQGTATRPAWW